MHFVETAPFAAGYRSLLCTETRDYPAGVSLGTIFAEVFAHYCVLNVSYTILISCLQYSRSEH